MYPTVNFTAPSKASRMVRRLLVSWLVLSLALSILIQLAAAWALVRYATAGPGTLLVGFMSPYTLPPGDSPDDSSAMLPKHVRRSKPAPKITPVKAFPTPARSPVLVLKKP